MRTLAAVLATAFLVTISGPATAKDAPAPATPAVVQEHRCPVMGHVVKDPSKAESSVYQGRTYYFCCKGCKPRFDADPEKYLSGK